MQASYKKNPIKLNYLNKTKKVFLAVCSNTVEDIDINYVDITGGTPLAWAAIIGDDKYVTELINRGATPNVRVFPFIYQVMKIDWILEPALSIITKIIPSHLKKFIIKDNILKVFKILKQHNYVNEDGIYIKYIINILYETTKYNCYIKSLLERWKTQEDFDRKIRLSFWLYPKIVDSNNYFIHKFYKDPIIATTLREAFIHKFLNNAHNSYSKISEIIPLNKKIGIDAFLNESWYKIIIPEMIYTMMVRVLCQDNIS
jgi:hypothetical protein